MLRAIACSIGIALVIGCAGGSAQTAEQASEQASGGGPGTPTYVEGTLGGVAVSGLTSALAHIDVDNNFLRIQLGTEATDCALTTDEHYLVFTLLPNGEDIEPGTFTFDRTDDPAFSGRVEAYSYRCSTCPCERVTSNTLNSLGPSTGALDGMLTITEIGDDTVRGAFDYVSMLEQRFITPTNSFEGEDHITGEFVATVCIDVEKPTCPEASP